MMATVAGVVIVPVSGGGGSISSHELGIIILVTLFLMSYILLLSYLWVEKNIVGWFIWLVGICLPTLILGLILL